MARILVLYYSSYGHIKAMARAVAEGALSTGAQVDIRRVPKTVPIDVAQSAHFKLDQDAPIATVAALADYDALIIGTGTRFGRMSSQMAAFLDQAGGLRATGALHGKVGGAFASCLTVPDVSFDRRPRSVTAIVDPAASWLENDSSVILAVRHDQVFSRHFNGRGHKPPSIVHAHSDHRRLR